MGNIAEIMGGGFDHTTIEKQDKSPLEPGWYDAYLEEAEIRTTKAGTGNYFWGQLVLFGKREGRKLWVQFNLRNPSQKAEEIGRREFAKFCEAAGAGIVQDTSELINKPLSVKVRVKDDQNEAHDFKAYSETGQTVAQPAQAAQAAPVPNPATKPAPVAASASGAAKKMPWQK